MNDISIGYLSWKRHNIFEQTLNSHKNNGLYDLILPENRFIFFQEISEIDIQIAKKFECEYFGDVTNIGILCAFIKLIENCKTKYFIFSENDWFLIENKEKTRKILDDCVNILQDNLCDVIKLRSRKNPGKPLWSRPKNMEKWLRKDNSNFPYKLESLSWLDSPNIIYNDILQEYLNNYKWYICNLKHQKWSNNIFIAKTDFLKKIILPLIKKEEYNNNKYSGLEDFLINYKSYENIEDIKDIVKKYQNTKLAAGEGLFMHKDYI
jgi:hypothetical protein